MGVTFGNLAMMAQAKQRGVCFDRILTIGHQKWYATPAQTRRLADRHVHAVRTAVVPIFSTFPIQSDYAGAHGNAGHQGLAAALRKKAAWLPRWVRNRLAGYYELWQYSTFNRRVFTPWCPI